MTAEYPGASWAPIPGFGFPQGAHGGNTPKFVILHGTASGDGTAAQQVRFFQGTNQHGVHFVIGKDGAVVQMVQLADAAYGNCCIDVAKHDAFWDTILQRFNNLNTCTISIEHCKIASDNSDVLTPAQQAASFKLVAWLCQHLNIPPRAADVSGGITGHFSINGINRANCPGAYPWQALWSFLGGSMVPTPPYIAYTFGMDIPASAGGWKAQAVHYGLSEADLLKIPGNEKFASYDGNSASVAGLILYLPGYAPSTPDLAQELAALQAKVAAYEAWLKTAPSL